MLALLQARKARTEVQGLTRKQLKEKQSIEADHKFWKTQVCLMCRYGHDFM